MLHRFEAKLSLDALFSPWNRVRGSCTNRWKRVGNPAMAVIDTLDIDPIRSPRASSIPSNPKALKSIVDFGHASKGEEILALRENP
uniref:Uncharacterized protein n=1 Tax=Candidatus Kentrum sp. LFY TaxID=2126342 RepID=A0A450WR20_9GAMM|nr:MAG: hypothetical protein BECKLFY1418C_GA0070996_10583 [Candidatus Kentron sp. LFY]